MADEGNDLFFPPPGVALPADENFFAPPPEPVPVVRRGGCQGRPRAPPDSGSVGCWVISTSIHSEPASSSSSAPLPSESWEYRLLEGLCVLRWSYKASADDVVPNGAAAPPPVAGDHGDGAPWGSVTYSIDEFHHFDTPPLIAMDIDLHCPFTFVLFEETYGERELLGGGAACDILQRGLLFDTAWLLPTAEVDALAELVLPATYRVVSLGSRIHRSCFLLGTPPQASVAYWRTKAGQTRRRVAPAAIGEAPESAGVRAMLELPPKRPRDDDPDRRVAPHLRSRAVELDPLRLLNAVAVTTHLKATEEFQAALQEFQNYENDDFAGEVQRDTSRDPGKSSNFRNQRRVDMVGMLVQRRIWHKEVLNDEVSAIIAFSDSSPVVGMEIQGMQCDVCRKDKTIRSVVMPGGNVYYGIQDAVAKMMIFMVRMVSFWS